MWAMSRGCVMVVMIGWRGLCLAPGPARVLLQLPAAPDAALLGGRLGRVHVDRWGRVLGRRAAYLLVEALGVSVRRCGPAPQLVYWLEGAALGHPLSPAATCCCFLPPRLAPRRAALLARASDDRRQSRGGDGDCHLETTRRRDQLLLLLLPLLLLLLWVPLGSSSPQCCTGVIIIARHFAAITAIHRERWTTQNNNYAASNHSLFQFSLSLIAISRALQTATETKT